MENIRYFKSNQEFEDFLNQMGVKFLNSGSEGEVYQTRENTAIKVMIYPDDCINLNANFNYVLEYQKIITANLVLSKYFLFPEELYVLGNQLCGYKTRLIQKDYFYGLTEPEQYLSFDLKKLERAFIRFQKEIERLSNLGILLYDLPTNIMYDGNEIYAGDTCGYTFDHEVSVKNQFTFQITFMAVFEQLLLNILDEDILKRIQFKDIKSYLAMIKSYCIKAVSERENAIFEQEDEFYPKGYLKVFRKNFDGLQD